jgi:hypothetical protein
MTFDIETLTRALLDLPQGLPVTIDCGGQMFRVGKVTAADYPGGAAIIETGDLGLTVAGIVAGLAQVAAKDGYGRKTPVELFVLTGDDYGYYNVGSLLVLDRNLRLTAGSMIFGGV